MEVLKILFFLMVMFIFSGCSNPLGGNSNDSNDFHPGVPNGVITQVQATPLGTQAAGATVTASFPSLPTKGNAVLIYIWGWDGAAAVGINAGSCSDNQGNAYSIAVTTSNNSGANNLMSAICYVTNVSATSGTFTVTVSPQLGNAATQIETIAVEYYGMAQFPVDQTAKNSGNSASATTTTTLITAVANELAASVVSSSAAVNPIIFTSLNGFTIVATQPDCSGFACGQAEGTTATTLAPYIENWTVNTSNFYNAVIATFKPE